MKGALKIILTDSGENGFLMNLFHRFLSFNLVSWLADICCKSCTLAVDSYQSALNKHLASEFTIYANFFLYPCRLCEICGQTAKNITGVGGNRFVEEWNERRFTGGSSNSSNRGRGCWRGQPFCNFLMACLVIAFVLPWFFRVNMF
jgi:hypothetical protein